MSRWAKAAFSFQDCRCQTLNIYFITNCDNCWCHRKKKSINHRFFLSVNGCLTSVITGISRDFLENLMMKAYDVVELLKWLFIYFPPSKCLKMQTDLERLLKKTKNTLTCSLFIMSGKKKILCYTRQTLTECSISTQWFISHQTFLEVRSQMHLNLKCELAVLAYAAAACFFFFFWLVYRITPLPSSLQEHPVVITKFIRGAREVEVDAVAKHGRVRSALIFFPLQLQGMEEPSGSLQISSCKTLTSTALTIFYSFCFFFAWTDGMSISTLYL